MPEEHETLLGLAVLLPVFVMGSSGLDVHNMEDSRLAGPSNGKLWCPLTYLYLMEHTVSVYQKIYH